MIEILHSAEVHAYLGRLLCGNLTRRNAVELTHRIRIPRSLGEFFLQADLSARSECVAPKSRAKHGREEAERLSVPGGGC